MSEQDYIPGTSVISNLVGRSETLPHGTPDQRVLDQAETFYVSTRMAELLREGHTAALRGAALGPLGAANNPATKPFTFAHMREIHRHLFQDVYAWAGEPRRVPMQKHSTSYAAPAEMNALLRQQYASIAEQDQLRGIEDQAVFASTLAGIWAEVNHAHAFREGNTRSQTVFFAELAHHAGWTLDVARLAPDHPVSVYKPFVDARFEHQRIRNPQSLSAQEAAQELAQVLGRVIAPDNSLEGRLRRAAPAAVPAAANRAADQTTQHIVKQLHARHPELRDMTLDPRGLSEASTTIPEIDGGHQL